MVWLWIVLAVTAWCVLPLPLAVLVGRMLTERPGERAGERAEGGEPGAAYPS